MQSQPQNCWNNYYLLDNLIAQNKLKLSLKSSEDPSPIDPHEIWVVNYVLFGLTLGIIIATAISFIIYDKYCYKSGLQSSSASRISKGLMSQSDKYNPLQTIEGSPRRSRHSQVQQRRSLCNYILTYILMLKLIDESNSNRNTSSNELDSTQKFLNRLHDHTKSRISKNSDTINEDQGRQSNTMSSNNLNNNNNHNYNYNYNRRN
eukprot:403362703